MSKKCTALHYNWRQCGDANDTWGEDYDFHEVGKNGVTRIVNMTPRENYCGPGFYDVFFDDGRVEVIYNANRAFYVEVEDQ
jgi:hypothetical protein